MSTDTNLSQQSIYTCWSVTNYDDVGIHVFDLFEFADTIRDEAKVEDHFHVRRRLFTSPMTNQVSEQRMSDLL